MTSAFCLFVFETFVSRLLALFGTIITSESGNPTPPGDKWERKLLVFGIFYSFLTSGRPLSSSTALQKIFNRHTQKLSYMYSCMPNMKPVISSHNKYILSNFSSPTQQPDTCNCRKKPDCPLEGKCLQSNVFYQATVITATTTETYIGLATNFKEHYKNDQSSLRHLNRRNETELSKYIWTLQDSKKPFQIKWKVLKKCKPYSNISKKCNLCLYEKFIIICKIELCSLNRRNELMSLCPHRNR